MADRSLVVRTAAVRALGHLGMPECAPPLVGAFTGRPGLENVAPVATVFHALIELGDVGVAAFIRALDDPREVVRTLCCHGLAQGPTGAGYVFDVGPLLAAVARDDESPHVRAAAVSAISALEDHRVIRAVERTLHDRDARVRRASARALGLLGAVESMPALLVATRDPDREVSLRAAEAIIRFADDPELKATVYAHITAGRHDWALIQAMHHRSVSGS